MTNEEQIIELLKQNQTTIELTYRSAEKTRKYFLYSMIFTLVAFLLPLLGIMLILPTFINTYTNSLEGLI